MMLAHQVMPANELPKGGAFIRCTVRFCTVKELTAKRRGSPL